MVANRKRSDRSFEINDYVFLKLQPYRQHSLVRRSSQKLAAKYYGPYRVVAKIRKVAYKLELPASTLIHPVFHVSQLKKHIGNHITQGTPPMIPKTATLQPRTVLDRRMVKLHNQAHTQVLILWEGLAPIEATWEDMEEFKL